MLTVHLTFVLHFKFTDIGVVTSLEVNHKPAEVCRKGVEVCMKIEPVGGEAPRLYGRHFDHTDIVVSKVTTFYAITLRLLLLGGTNFSEF